jgi:hypothetical protein
VILIADLNGWRAPHDGLIANLHWEGNTAAGPVFGLRFNHASKKAQPAPISLNS